MKIQNIRLEGFRGFEHLEVEFPTDAQVLVFIGENGSGKTSLIEAISMMLQDVLQKYHNYEKVDWDNPMNVNRRIPFSRLFIDIQGSKRRLYTFFQPIMGDSSIYSISKDRLMIEKNRDLTAEEEIEYYINLAKSAQKKGNYEKVIESYQKVLALIQKNKIDSRIVDLAKIYAEIAYAYSFTENYEKAIEYYEKFLVMEEKSILKNGNISFLQLPYTILQDSYKKLGNEEKASFYKVKNESLLSKLESKESEQTVEIQNSENYIKYQQAQLQHFNEYIEALNPLVLHYSAKSESIENYKNALPIAFNIPMTTDFAMISDWFIEHENDENRKRLRVNPEYRNAELNTVRKVIKDGLNLLNDQNEAVFDELQTEIDETVKDGQVSSWLSIKKNGLRLNVKQLSDGEKRVLVLLVDIVRRLITLAKMNKETDFLKGAGVVLIDEIEQHLHPKWQRTLLPTLSALFPNVQFVVTTHSPQVLSYVPNGCAFALEEGKAYPQNTYGKNNEWILEAIMDDVNRPKEVQAKLNEYFDLIREDKLDLAEELRKNLEKLIGEDEPELLKADILIRRKQKNTTKNETNS